MRRKPKPRATLIAEAKAFRVAEELAAIQAESADLHPELLAYKVIDALGGDSVTYALLDERPHYFGERDHPFHSVLRDVRNSPRYAPLMFASFNR